MRRIPHEQVKVVARDLSPYSVMYVWPGHKVTLIRRFSARRRVSQAYDAGWYDRAFRTSSDYSLPYYASRYYFLWAVIADRLRGTDARVLDVGCGGGQLASLLIEHGIASYTGFDFSPVAVSMARKAAPAATFFEADALDAGAYVGDYSVVICAEVLEHVLEDTRVVGLFPSGAQCICTVPDFPYESHVRHFDSAEEVASRYGAFFDDIDVMTLKARSPDHNTIIRFFLFEGTRNTEHRI